MSDRQTKWSSREPGGQATPSCRPVLHLQPAAVHTRRGGDCPKFPHLGVAKGRRRFAWDPAIQDGRRGRAKVNDGLRWVRPDVLGLMCTQIGPGNDFDFNLTPMNDMDSTVLTQPSPCRRVNDSRGLRNAIITVVVQRLRRQAELLRSALVACWKRKQGGADEARASFPYCATLNAFG